MTTITAEDRALLIALPGRLRAMADEIQAALEATDRLHGELRPPDWDDGESPRFARGSLEEAAWDLGGALGNQGAPDEGIEPAEALADLLRQAPA